MSQRPATHTNAKSSEDSDGGATCGLDIDSINLVLNYKLARDREVHGHRIGRTARAGKNGIACSLILERERLRSTPSKPSSHSKFRECPFPTPAPCTRGSYNDDTTDRWGQEPKAAAGRHSRCTDWRRGHSWESRGQNQHPCPVRLCRRLAGFEQSCFGSTLQRKDQRPPVSSQQDSLNLKKPHMSQSTAPRAYTAVSWARGRSSAC